MRKKRKKKEEKKQVITSSKPRIKTLNIIVILVLALILIISIVIYIPKDCKNNQTCFIKKAQSCSKAKVLTYKENNLYSYEIKGEQRNSCLVNIKLIRMKPNTDIDIVELMEGKGMLCAIAKEQFKTEPLGEIKDITDFCSGPLKEAYLQLTIERLYSLVISNIGGITQELENLVNTTK